MNYEDYFYGNTATLLNSRLSIRGGDEKTKFFVSGSLTDEGGIVRRTGFERQSVRANIEHKLSKSVVLSVNSNYIRTNTDRGFTEIKITLVLVLVTIFLMYQIILI